MTVLDIKVKAVGGGICEQNDSKLQQMPLFSKRIRINNMYIRCKVKRYQTEMFAAAV